jgi:CBS domain containing-hemolysin-like protein
MTDTSSSSPSSSWLGKILGKAGDTPEENQTQRSRKRMMNAAENFHVLRVEDVMVPRANIVGVERDTGIHDLSAAFRDAGHSRLPVYKETLDEPLGMIHIKDLMPLLMLNAKGRNHKGYADKKVAQGIMRPVLYVPASMLAEELLARMQARRVHMAIVVDEYGGTDGLVTLEDLVEPIVGDIEDEHDETGASVKQIIDNAGSVFWEADAATPIDDCEAKVGRDFATVDEESEVDTIGGLVFTLAGRVPERGEIIAHTDGIEFEVIDADARRVKRLRIRDTKKRGRGQIDKTESASLKDKAAQDEAGSKAAQGK